LSLELDYIMGLACSWALPSRHDSGAIFRKNGHVIIQLARKLAWCELVFPDVLALLTRKVRPSWGQDGRFDVRRVARWAPSRLRHD